MSEALDNTLLKEAMTRIGRTPDGRILYLFLQKVLMGIPSESGPDDCGALRINHGRRILASEIRNLLSEGVKQVDPGIDERPVIFAATQPVALSKPGTRGARRRVSEPGTEPGTSAESGTKSRAAPVLRPR